MPEDGHTPIREIHSVCLLQPVHQLREVIRGFVGVIAVEKDDAFDVARNLRHSVEITKRQTPAAAVAGEHNLLPIIREDAAHGVEQRGNVVVAIRATPRGPAFQRVLQIRDDDGLIRQRRAKKTRLCADMLDVEMPVIARLHLFADGLLNGVAVGHREEDEEEWLHVRTSPHPVPLPFRRGEGGRRSGEGRSDFCRCVNDRAHAVGQAELPGHLAKVFARGKTLRPALAGIRNGNGRKKVCWITRLVDHAFIAEQRTEIGVAQDSGEVRGLAVEQHVLRDEPDAVAVIHPICAMPGVERLDRHAVRAMPTVDGDLVCCAGELGRDDHVFLVSCNECGRYTRFAEREKLRTDDFVVRGEDGNGGHLRVRREWLQGQFHFRSGVDSVHHLARRQYAAKFISDVLSGGWCQRCDEAICVRADGQIIACDKNGGGVRAAIGDVGQTDGVQIGE